MMVLVKRYVVTEEEFAPGKTYDDGDELINGNVFYFNTRAKAEEKKKEIEEYFAEERYFGEIKTYVRVEIEEDEAYVDYWEALDDEYEIIKE